MSLKSTVSMNYHLCAFGSLEPSAYILNSMFSCTLQTSSTKIILLTSTRHPRTAGSLHAVDVGGSRASPLTQSDQPRHVILQSTWILLKKCSPVFLHVVNKTAKQLILKGLITILLNRLNTVDLGPFRLLQSLVLIIESQLLKAEVEDCSGREALWSCYWRQNEVLRFLRFAFFLVSI